MAILRGRRWQGEYWDGGRTPAGRDPILARILWLSGLEPGKNLGGKTDTFRRYIYIHGTADLSGLGLPVSAGCIRMSPQDVITLFNRSPCGTPVFIGLEYPRHIWPQRRE